nr:MAG TPA: hypothetical protein [Caudoviricetes sp.]
MNIFIIYLYRYPQKYPHMFFCSYKLVVIHSMPLMVIALLLHSYFRVPLSRNKESTKPLE